MRIPLLLVFLLITACGDYEPSNNHGYGFHYAAKAESGLRLRYEPGVPATLTQELLPPEAMVGQFEQIYSDVEKCAGLTTISRPLVIIVPMGSLAPRLGLEFLDTRTVLVEEFSAFRGFVWNVRHEYIHDLLAATGFPEDRNSAHDSPLFDACGPV